MAQLKWGDDGLLWGDDRLTWGPDGVPVQPTPVRPRAIPVDPEEEFRGATPLYLHALLSIFFRPTLRLWSGFEELDFDGHSYMGALHHLGFSMGNRQSQQGGRAGRVPISFQIGDEATELRQLLIDNSPSGFEAELMLIYSVDAEQWHVAPNITRGRLQNARLQGGQYSLEIVNPDLEAYRLPELIWSHASQLNQYNGRDLGFEFAAAIADGSVVAQFPQDVTSESGAIAGTVSSQQASLREREGGEGDRDGQGEPGGDFPGDDPDADPGPQ